MKRPRTLHTLFLLLLTASVHRCQPKSVSLNGVSHIATGVDEVFASAGSNIYRYSTGLDQLQSASLTDAVVGLTATPDGQFVVACITSGPCFVRNGTNITDEVRNVMNVYGTLNAADGLTLFTANVSGVLSFYAGSYGQINNDGITNIRFNQYGLVGNSIDRPPSLHPRNNFIRQYYGGFYLRDYAYYIVVDPANSLFQQLRIVRVCNEGSLESQYELQLECVSQLSSAIVRGVSVIEEEILVIGVTSGSADKLCSYDISEISSLMNNTYRTCILEGDSSTSRNVLWTQDSCTQNIKSNPEPCNFADDDVSVAIAPSNPLSSTDVPVNNDTVLSGLRASFGLVIDNVTLIYVGFVSNSKYYLNRYHWDRGLLNLTEEVLISESNIEESTEVSITVSQDGQFVFLTTVDEIVQLPIENCSRAVSCDECVSLGDPLCGWCMFEGKCSRRSFCMDSESPGRYLSQGESSSCISRVNIEPPEYVLELEEVPYQVMVNFVPDFTVNKLPGEELFCVFSNENMDIEVKSVLETDMCSVSEVIGQLSGISLSTEFAVFSNRTNVKFFTSDVPFVFYNCESVSRCSECVQAAGGCGWCLLDFTCTGDNTTCTGGPNNWIMESNGNSSRVCPLLVPNDDAVSGSYAQPVNVAENLTLITLNTPAETSGLSYQCVFGSEPRPATRVSETSVECTIGNGQQLQFTGGSMMTQTKDFTLRQRNSTNSLYDLETSKMTDINVVLYDCQSLAGSCSQCLGQNINTGFKCGWCSSVNQCTVSEQCNEPITTMSGECDNPMITMINPQSGPPRGTTTITIDGTNLGVESTDILSIRVGQRNCTSIDSQYSSGVRIVCITNTGGVNPVGNATVTVNISTSDGNKQVTSQFTVLQPGIDSVTPGVGPVSGGTQVIIRGSNLDIGNRDNTKVLFRAVPGSNESCTVTECDINESTFNSSYLSCVSERGGSGDCLMEVVVTIDNVEYSRTNVRFLYKPDPVLTDVSPQDIIPAGGTTLTFSGSYLNVTQSPVIQIIDTRFNASQKSCYSPENGDTLICVAPRITPSSAVTSAVDSTIQYRVIFDGASGPESGLDLMLRANPVVNRVMTQRIPLSDEDTATIRFAGQNLISSLGSDTSITIGQYICQSIVLAGMSMTCDLSTGSIENEMSLYANVTIGRNLKFGNTSTEWRVTFVMVGNGESSINPAAIGGGVGGGLLFVLILFVIVVVVIIIVARSSSKQKDMRFTKLLSDMERMELEMAVTCKTAFTELQTDLGELVTDDSLESHNLPFQPFPAYATKIFFPHAGTEHPVLSPPRLPPNMTEESFSELMTEFRGMVMDKSFLTSFIRTLESQDKLTLHEKSTIASLLMVAFLQDVTYATEILQVLLGDLIRRSISQTRNHPKILLRRTESVAEKLLTNWFCVTLYPYLLETVGPPMFVLFKAVKAQLEKGPIDVINGEAKNSLSEEKLLRQALEFKTIECEVEMSNANHLLSKMRSRLTSKVDLEPCNVGQDEIQTIRLLDTDSISQTKEKLLDFIYRNRPVSLRPSITDIELELCRGNAGIPLRDQDGTSKKDGEYTKINTLGHYNIPEMAEAAIEDPKKTTPRFRLRYRADRPPSVPSFDVPGTIIASASVTSQTSLLNAAAIQGFDGNTNKMFHLVKPETGDGETKIVSEVFLTRLLSTKRILQPYVDDLFHAIFNIPHGKPLPKAIKVFFDFLDQIAAELSITDPDVLHIWKTNGLPLRFWVNLIKNPEFIFDINKSATIDACFTIIAQAYIDACSTSEVTYTKDTPSARLLYVKEVMNYKKEVLNYYSGVQSLPRVTFEELRSHFKESLDPFFDEFEKHEGIHFHSDSALLELYRYAVQYGDAISETLSEDRLTMIAAQFNNLRQRFDINSSPV